MLCKFKYIELFILKFILNLYLYSNILIYIGNILFRSWHGRIESLSVSVKDYQYCCLNLLDITKSCCPDDEIWLIIM